MTNRNIAQILVQPINKFIRNESSAGIILFLSALIAMLWANSAWKESYHHLWEIPLSISLGDFEIKKTLHHWINDGLMAVFFFVIGLELKREVVGGELSEPKNAILPIAAGVGGMLVPAAIFIALNHTPEAAAGWGIPMATDIAFALGIMSLLGERVPVSLKVFLTALAIADDLGAVLVIAFFYTSQIDLLSLITGIGFLGLLLTANLMGIRKTLIYGILGIGGLWIAFLLSGVHATIAGVLAALTIPASTKVNEQEFSQDMEELIQRFREADPNNSPLITAEQLHILEAMKKTCAAAETPLQKLEHGMHGLVAYIVMPIFALANAGIELGENLLQQGFTPLTLAVAVGLILGKLLGITAAVGLLVKTGIAELPPKTSWMHIIGVACLAGIGFTMSLFIAELAYEDLQLINQAKLGVLMASIVAGLIGYFILQRAATGSTAQS
ncbi:MAG: Na+/H+ antiporter NhaA [Cytophagales bacterium]|nr:Na+/H+ antiporter NhaA [Bernardetiaceae bacterium]MDW8205512.1 Na+/H+ antiporter NhaA [Cytophagales bacterium]